MEGADWLRNARVTDVEWNRIARALDAIGRLPSVSDRSQIAVYVAIYKRVSRRPRGGAVIHSGVAAAFERVATAADELAAALADLGAIGGGMDHECLEALGATGASSCSRALPGLADLARVLAAEERNMPTPGPRKNDAADWLDRALWGFWKGRGGSPADEITSDVVAFYEGVFLAAGRRLAPDGIASAIKRVHRGFFRPAVSD